MKTNISFVGTKKTLCGFLFFLCLVLQASFVQSGEQADRAVSEVKRLVRQGLVTPDTVLKLVAKQGNIVNFLGTDHELKHQWERATGIIIDVNTMPQKASLAYIRDAKAVDLTIARNREYADLYHEGLIIDLQGLMQKFGFNLEGTSSSSFILPRQQAFFSDIPVAIPADGDVAVLYLRSDLIQKPANQKRYKALYGVDLKIPKTWTEYSRQVEFFNDPDNDFFGALEQRDEASGWMFWMPRYASQSYPNQLLFDEQMNPLINSEEGIAATESYIRTVKYSPEGILNPESNYTFTLPLFLNGKGYSTIITLAGAKIFNLAHSKVAGKFKAVPMPGKRIRGRVHRRSTLIYGNNLVIPQVSENKELAFLFAMWLTDPEISERSLSMKGGFADPYRLSHFKSETIRETYGAEILSTVMAELEQVVPAGTGLPGDTEYISALNKQLHLAASGEKNAQQAMQDTAAEWDKITEKYGRERQIQYWSKVRVLFPGQSL